MKTTALLSCLLTASIVCCGSFAAEPQLDFTPKHGFSGSSTGKGTLKMLLGKPLQFQVQSQGTEQRDGTFRLEQRLTFQGEPPHERVWILTTVAPNRYSGRLSDAAGPVTGSTSGTHL